METSAPRAVVADLSSASCVHRDPRSSGHTIALIAAEHGPDDARELVGHRSNGDVERSSGDQTIDPRPETTATANREPDQRSCAMHQRPARIPITPLADAEQTFSATGRVLARGEAEPRGKAAAAGKDLRPRPSPPSPWRYRADARDCSQPPGGLVVACLLLQAPVEIGDLVSNARRCST